MGIAELCGIGHRGLALEGPNFYVICFLVYWHAKEEVLSFKTVFRNSYVSNKSRKTVCQGSIKLNTLKVPLLV